MRMCRKTRVARVKIWRYVKFWNSFHAARHANACVYRLLLFKAMPDWSCCLSANALYVLTLCIHGVRTKQNARIGLRA